MVYRKKIVFLNKFFIIFQFPVTMFIYINTEYWSRFVQTLGNAYALTLATWLKLKLQSTYFWLYSGWTYTGLLMDVDLSLRPNKNLLHIFRNDEILQIYTLPNLYICEPRETPVFCRHSHFFIWNWHFLLYSKIQINVALLSVTEILMIPIKLATQDIFKIKVFWNEEYDFITSVYSVINESFSRVLNYVVDLVIWPKFGNSSISFTEVVMNKRLFEGWPGIRYGLAILRQHEKGLKLKVRKFWGLTYYFREVKGIDLPPHSG